MLVGLIGEGVAAAGLGPRRGAGVGGAWFGRRPLGEEEYEKGEEDGGTTVHEPSRWIQQAAFAVARLKDHHRPDVVANHDTRIKHAGLSPD